MKHQQTVTVGANWRVPLGRFDQARKGRYESLLRKALGAAQQGRLVLETPDGQQLLFGVEAVGEPFAQICITNPRALRRLFTGGEIGFAESYMDGDWYSPDLRALFNWALVNDATIRSATQANAILRLANRLHHVMRANTPSGSRRNIAYHYDLGNDFYGQWLDETMTYSSALFDDPDQTLAGAQAHKYQAVCDMAELRSGMNVLEVGCGWGGFAETAAGAYGCRVDGITLSGEQLVYARDRISAVGLSDKARFSLTDYRDLKDSYDRIVSIEMFEAVGEENWDRYFQTLARCLKPNGNAVLQVITIDHERFKDYRKGAEFIQRYIFPGGLLPSREALEDAVQRNGWTIEATHFFGDSYARTLRHWRRNFLESWLTIETLGFDERFKRMWEYYLAYCEAGFSFGSIDVGLFKLRRSL